MLLLILTVYTLLSLAWYMHSLRAKAPSAILWHAERGNRLVPALTRRTILVTTLKCPPRKVVVSLSGHTKNSDAF